MPFVPTPNGIQAAMRYTQDEQSVVNVFNFLSPLASPTLAELEAVCQLLFTWWDQYLKTVQTTTVTLREIYATDISSQTGPVFTFTEGLPASGAAVSAPLPNNVSMCVSLRTALRGRSYRGRSFYIGLTENQVVGNRVTPSTVVYIQDAYDDLVSTAAAAGTQMAVLSLRNNKNPRVQGVLTPINDAVIIDDVVDSMRRRLPGRGK